MESYIWRHTHLYVNIILLAMASKCDGQHGSVNMCLLYPIENIFWNSFAQDMVSCSFLLSYI